MRIERPRDRTDTRGRKWRRVTAATAEGPPSTRARECGRSAQTPFQKRKAPGTPEQFAKILAGVVCRTGRRRFRRRPTRLSITTALAVEPQPSSFRLPSSRAMSLTMRASIHAPQRGARGSRAPRSGSLATPSRKHATCHHAFGESAPLFDAIGDDSTRREGSPRDDPPRLSRRAALSMSASVSLMGLGIATTARCDARPADMHPSARRRSRSRGSPPPSRIPKSRWTPGTSLCVSPPPPPTRARLPDETVSLWLAARADCLASLRRWADAERAYGEAAEALARVVSAQVTTSGTGGRIDSGEASVPMYARLAMAHDGRALAAGAIDDWPLAVEASRRATAAAGLGGMGSGSGSQRMSGERGRAATSPRRRSKPVIKAGAPHRRAARRARRGDGAVGRGRARGGGGDAGPTGHGARAGRGVPAVLGGARGARGGAVGERSKAARRGGGRRCARRRAEPARDPHERREGGGEQSRAGAVRRVRRPDG